MQASWSSGDGSESRAVAACSGVVCARRRLDAPAATRDSTTAASGVSVGAADGSGCQRRGGARAPRVGSGEGDGRSASGGVAAPVRKKGIFSLSH
jgi:hypothetical protein